MCLWAHGWNITKIVLFMPFLGTLLQVRLAEAWWLKRRGLAQWCDFWGLVHMALHLGSQKKPKLPILGHEQKLFKPNSRNRKTCILLKLTASIPTKFCTVIKTTKCLSWVVTTHALQIQDGGRPPSWKNQKNVISQPRFVRFWRKLASGWSSILLTVPNVKNLKFQKSKMAAAAILKIVKWRYLSCGLSDFDEIWHGDAVRPSWLFGPLQRSKEIQDAGGRRPNKLKITISRQWFEQPSDFSVFT